MSKYNFEEMTDEEFEKLFEPFDKKMEEYIEKDDFTNRYIAYFIAEEYKDDLLPDDSLQLVVRTALEDLSYLKPNMDIVKDHLKNKYHLEIINEDNIELKEL